MSNGLRRLLERAGHTVYSARALQMSAANDLEHLLAAADRGAVLVTHDKKDFLLLHRTWLALARRWSAVELHPGVLVLPPGTDVVLFQLLAEFWQLQWPVANSLYRCHAPGDWRAEQ